MSSHWQRLLFISIILPALAILSQPALAQFTQQGPKLVGTGAVAPSGLNEQGYGVALSADGNTAIVGGPIDNAGLGAAWVYTRSHGAWTQQGGKLVGTGAVVVSNFVEQGLSVALSADGNTAIVGGPLDNAGLGAAWVFTRASGQWAQQGPKLVGTGAVTTSGFVDQGYSVALSADGNTAIIGGYNDNAGLGAAWVFTRSSGVWSQQGLKLVGTGAVGTSGLVNQGWSVALSADGNTAIVGGIRDNAELGAAWVFTRSGTTWTQQGNKLVGTGAVNAAFVQQGSAVALSSDGNTAIVGGSSDDTSTGATWVFTRTGTTWTQQGNKLVGTGAIGGAFQGEGVALSYDGNTAIVGGPGDNASLGATWVFSRSGTTWTQQGNKLVGTGAVATSGQVYQGQSVALSGNGTTAIVGGPYDSASFGAAWIFARPWPTVATHDFDGDGKSDIAWRNTNGDLSIWLMNGSGVAASADLGIVPNGWSVVGQRDFDGDGKADLLWRNTNGDLAIWFMNGTAVSSAVDFGIVPTSWSVAGTGDFNNDGKGDILWHDTSGNVAIWLMNGGTVSSSVFVANVPTSWSIAGSSGDGILWRDTAGDVALWLMSGGTVSQSISLGNVPTSWSIVGSGDFNGDGNTDILWQDTSGNTAVWLLNGSGIVTSAASLGVVPTSWSVAETGDFDGDGKSDILWRDTSGNTAIWFMNGAAVSSAASLGNVPTTWLIQGANAD